MSRSNRRVRTRRCRTALAILEPMRYTMSAAAPVSFGATSLAARFGLRYPILVAPMFIISNKEMIVAAAEAGIMGSMPSLNQRTHEGFRNDLKWIRDHVGDKPFGINLTIGLTDPERLEQDISACLEFEVPLIITSYGDPTALVARAHEREMAVFHDVINLRHAKKAEAAGVDAIIGVSAGAGGHAGRISPFILYPYLRRHLSVPIIAAGGITTGEQVAASLTLGAELCYMGTRFIASTECGAPEGYKEMIVEAGPEDIEYTDAVSGIHANFLRQTIPEEHTASRGPDAAKKWRDIWSAGHGVGLIDEIAPIAQIVDQIAREYHDAIAALK